MRFIRQLFHAFTIVEQIKENPYYQYFIGMSGYEDKIGIDLQILIESDFIVNLYEEGASLAAVHSVYNSVFATETEKELCI